MALKNDLSVDQGADFALSVIIQESAGLKDFTGYSGAAQIRRSAADSNIAAAFTVTFNSPATDGVVNLAMSAATTATLPVGVPLVYDLLVTSGGGKKTRVLEGSVNVDPAVTR